MNTPMTHSDSTTPTSVDRSLIALLRDAQALAMTATASALREAGSSPRELRLLERLARANDSDGSDRSRHITRRLDVKVAQPGSVAATFAARGWITYADQTWQLTSAGEAERARLAAIVAEAVPAGDALRAELTSLIEALGGAEAARAAHHAHHRGMRKRMGKHEHGCGRGERTMHHRGHGEHPMHHRGHPTHDGDHGEHRSPRFGHPHHPHHPHHSRHERHER